MRGTPEAIVRQWVEHVDSHALKLYTHIADEASQTAMQRLEEQKLPCTTRSAPAGLINDETD